MLLDTDVMVDVVRGFAPAITWLGSLSQTGVGLPGIAAMELLQGCRNLADQQRVEREIQRFLLFWPTPADCARAFQNFRSFRLSHNLGLLDALIGETAVGLARPLATFNVKHYSVIPGLVLLQPY